MEYVVVIVITVGMLDSVVVVDVVVFIMLNLVLLESGEGDETLETKGA